MDPHAFVPDVVKPFWPYIAGGLFPEQRYGDMVAKADEQEGIADALARLRKEAGDGVAALLRSGVWEGAAQAEFAQLFGELVRDVGGDPDEVDPDPVAALAYVEHAVRQGASMTRKQATDIEHTQVMMIAGAIMTGVAILRLLAFAIANPSATALISSRLAFERMRNQAIKGIVLRNMLVFGAIMGGLDGGIQLGQMLVGHRDEINFESLLWSTGTGALTGALFGGMKVGAASLVTDDMVGMVARNEAKTLRTLLAGAPDTVLGQTIMGGVAGTTAGAVTLGATGQLTRENLLYALGSGLVGGIGPTAPRPLAQGGPGLPPARHPSAAGLPGAERPGRLPQPADDGAARVRPAQPEAAPARPPAERPTALAQQSDGAQVKRDKQVWPRPDQPQRMPPPGDGSLPAAVPVTTSRAADRPGTQGPARSANDGPGAPAAHRSAGDRPGMPVADQPAMGLPEAVGDRAGAIRRMPYEGVASHPVAQPHSSPQPPVVEGQVPRPPSPATLAHDPGMSPPDAGPGGWRPGNSEVAVGRTVADMLGLRDVPQAQAQLMGRFHGIAPEVVGLQQSPSSTLNSLVAAHGGRNVVTAYVSAVEAGHPVSRATDVDSMARGLADFMRQQEARAAHGRPAAELASPVRDGGTAGRSPEVFSGEWVAQRLGLDPPGSGQARILNRLDQLVPELAHGDRSASEAFNGLVDLHGRAGLAEVYVRAVEAGYRRVTEAHDAGSLARGLDDFIQREGARGSGERSPSARVEDSPDRHADQGMVPREAGPGAERPKADLASPVRNGDGAMRSPENFSGDWVALRLGLDAPSPGHAWVLDRLDGLVPELAHGDRSASEAFNGLVDLHGRAGLAEMYVRAVEEGHPVAIATDADSLARGLTDFAQQQESLPIPQGPRTHAHLARSYPELSFPELEAMRAASYRTYGQEPPAMSRESTDAFLERIWAERSSIGNEDQVYRKYAFSEETKSLDRRPRSYMKVLIDLARSRPYSLSFDQRTRQALGERSPRDSRNARGFFHFVRKGADFEVTQRLYLHAMPKSAPELMSALVKEIVDEPRRFPGVDSAKIAGHERITQRHEGIVIYLADQAATDRVVQWLGDYHERNPGVLVRNQPPMTQPVMDGVSLGAEPSGSGFSFGSLRTNLIYNVLERVRSDGGDLDAFMSEVYGIFERNGVDPANPHANNGNES